MAKVGLIYFLKGNRQGFDILPQWDRLDKPDGYTEFRDKNGECKAGYLTALLGSTDG